MNDPKKLSWLARSGLERLGDCMAPGDGTFPSFKKLGCAEHFYRIGEYMPDQDRSDLLMLLTVFGFFPKIFIRLILKIIEGGSVLPDFLGGAFLRFLRLGLRGLVWSLYYSGWKGARYPGKTPLEILGYQVGVNV